MGHDPSHSLPPARSRGFSLPEMMAVIAIVAIAGAVGTSVIQGSSRAQNAASMARWVHLLMLEARSEAVSDGFQRRLLCVAGSCTAEIATSRGMGTPAGWRSAGTTIQSGAQGQVWAITSTTDLTTQNPSGPLGASRSITFFPDGTATPATVYVCDNNRRKKYKTYVYSATGMARMVDRW